MPALSSQGWAQGDSKRNLPEVTQQPVAELRPPFLPEAAPLAGTIKDLGWKELYHLSFSNISSFCPLGGG